MNPLEIDGAYGEGGGQLVRTAVALAALTGKSIRIENIRARRDKPGLAPQHLAAVRAVAAVSNASVTNLELRSQRIEFSPGELSGGEFRFDVGTAGSVTLVLQAVLPALVAGRERAKVVVTGGTDVRMAPSIDYLCEVLLWFLNRMGARVSVDVRCRGYYPKGNGEISVVVEPARLQPLQLTEAGKLDSIQGRVHVANLPLHIAERMRDAMNLRLSASVAQEAQVEMLFLGPDDAFGTGGAVVAWAHTAHTVLGAGRVAERGVRAEILGDSVGSELAADLNSGATLDLHASDQLLIYLALTGGQSVFTAQRLTSHAQTAIWLIEKFLPVKFHVLQAGPLVRVEVEPR